MTPARNYMASDSATSAYLPWDSLAQPHDLITVFSGITTYHWLIVHDLQRFTVGDGPCNFSIKAWYFANLQQKFSFRFSAIYSDDHRASQTLLPLTRASSQSKPHEALRAMRWALIRSKLQLPHLWAAFSITTFQAISSCVYNYYALSQIYRAVSAITCTLRILQDYFLFTRKSLLLCKRLICISLPLFWVFPMPNYVLSIYHVYFYATSFEELII